MSNTPKNPAQKTPGNDYSNPSKQGTNPSQKGQDQNSDRDSTRQQKEGGMKNDPKSSDSRREREEEDRPRAGSK